nr:MAG TPA: Recombination and repair protein [Caudoviricetes sp.]
MVMSSLMERLKKNSKIKETASLLESKFFESKEQIVTDVPAINIALSGSLDGGLQSGLTVVAGPSKHFKSSICLVMAAAYQKKYADGVILFYDSEFGSPQSYFEAFGVDTNRVIHTPITDIEQLKFDIMSQLQELKKGDHVMILIDSIGNLASKKEVEDALNEKAVADMSRAKQLKSLFRMVTPHLTMKDLPMVAINHTYQTLEIYSKAQISGGTGILYSANDAWIISRSQEKDGTELAGYTFTINIEKSRRVKEKSKIPLTVMFDGGITRYSGLLDLALEAGIVIKPSMGWFQKVDPATGEVLEGKYRAKDTDTAEFWEPLLKSKEFNDAVRQKFLLVHDTPNEVTDDE